MIPTSQNSTSITKHLRTQDRTLKETGSFTQVNAEHVWWHGDDDNLAAVQQSCIHRISTGQLVQKIDSYGEFCTVMVFLSVSSPKSITSYWEIMPTVYNYVNACNHGYTFCSWMRLIYPGRYYQHKGVTLLGTQKSMWGRRMSFSVNVWYGVLGNRLIGPCATERRLIAPYYRSFVENQVLLHLQALPLATWMQICLKNYGAPLHFSRVVMGFLNEDYKGRSIKKGGGPVDWPAQSPDLTHQISFSGVVRIWQCITVVNQKKGIS
jgi:hypothetical protein